MKILTPVALAVLFIAPAANPVAQAADPIATSNTVLDLPKLTVTDDTPLPELEKWSYVRLGEFEVLSNASLKPSQQLLADFQKFRRAVLLIWPAPEKPLAASS